MIRTLPSAGLTTSRIVSDLKTKHPDIINSESSELTDIALIRIVSQIGARRSTASENVYPDLFGEYGVQPTVYITVKVDGAYEKILKHVTDLTIAEAAEYATEHGRQIKSTSATAKEIGRMADDAKASGAKLNDTIGGWWATKAG
jgi:hypothetical protein